MKVAIPRFWVRILFTNMGNKVIISDLGRRKLAGTIWENEPLISINDTQHQAVVKSGFDLDSDSALLFKLTFSDEL